MVRVDLKLRCNEANVAYSTPDPQHAGSWA